MGIKIYIKLERLKEQKVRMIESSETETMLAECYCNYSQKEVCEECGHAGETYTNRLIYVDGIPFTMYMVDDNTMYHDANRYGSSRKPLLEFIEKYRLMAGEEWYEA